jgi:hypothetical protein
MAGVVSGTVAPAVRPGAGAGRRPRMPIRATGATRVDRLVRADDAVPRVRPRRRAC